MRLQAKSQWRSTKSVFVYPNASSPPVLHDFPSDSSWLRKCHMTFGRVKFTTMYKGLCCGRQKLPCNPLATMLGWNENTRNTQRGGMKLGTNTSLSTTCLLELRIQAHLQYSPSSIETRFLWSVAADVETMFIAEVICCPTTQPAICSRPEEDGSRNRYILEHLRI